MAGQKSRNSATKGWLITVTLLVALVLGGILWWRHLNVLPPIVAPAMRPLPTPNAHDYFVKAATSLGDSVLEYRGPTDRATPEMARLVATHVAALATVLEGLRHDYGRRFRDPAQDFFAARADYVGFRDLARLLSFHGQITASRGEWRGMADDSLDAMRLGTAITHDGDLQTFEEGSSCQEDGRAELWQYLDRVDAALAKDAARQVIELADSQAPLADIATLEKHFGLLLVRMGMQHPQTAGVNPVWDRRGTMLRAMRLYDAWIVSARQPYAVAKGTWPSVPADEVIRKLAVGQLPSAAAARYAANLAKTRLLAVALALRAYRLEHGTYPPTLASLAPGYLARVPDDPFAISGPLRYKLATGKYLLYSIGPDGKDDGGKPIRGISVTGEPNVVVLAKSIGDVVAGVNVP